MTKKIRKRDAVASRQAIIEAAIRTFAQAGFANASFQKIADLAGVSQANVFYHFPTRDNLVEAALGAVVQINQALVASLVDPSHSADKVLFHYGAGNFQWALQHLDQVQIIHLAYYLGGGADQFSEHCSRLSAGGQSRIEAILRSGIREKVFLIEESSVPRIAEFLHDALLGCIQKRVSSQRAKSAPSDAAALASFRKKWKILIDTWAVTRV